MNDRKIKNLLSSVRSGRKSVSDAFEILKHLPYEDFGHTKVDHHREIRHGVPEIIFAEGKELKDITVIAESMLKKSGKFLITKADRTLDRKISAICRRYGKKQKYFDRSGVIAVGGERRKKGTVAVISAGTSDIPVAEEAVVTATFLGSRVKEIYDVGVAGLHRLFDKKEAIDEANVLVVAAGMEGALPSVIGGMTDKPIIAVPTSVGYGTSFGGITALLAMLNSCVPGIAVMNIDNGFGAGVLAHKINILNTKQ